jgi:aryl-alcohol dehydrogenase-like predicted oxidoreductase
MLTTTLGGIPVGRLGFGCFALSGGYGEADPAAAVAMIHAVLDAGVNLLDTSDAYAAGENEVLVGRALAGHRERAVVATKFGWVLDDAGRAVRLDSSPAQVRKACVASLRRLGTDHIDVYIQHRVDPEVPIEATMGELMRLREEGKILAMGLSEAAPATLSRANEVAEVAALQTEYSLWSREPEAELLPLCDRLGTGFMAYSPLGRGFLTGTVRSVDDLPENDFRRDQPRFARANLKRNLVRVDRLAQLAGDLGCSAPQLALAWLLARPWNVIPIPSTRSLGHLQDNLKALELELSAADLAAAGEAVSPDSIQGERHPEQHMKTLNR